LIQRIGFVQIDSIRTVERAHDMILFARNQTYKPKHLKQLLEQDGELFEHWTHDASIVPSQFYQWWRHRFRREASGILERWKKWGRGGFEDKLDDVLAHISQNGACMCRDMGDKANKGGDGWWNWHPSKTALEFLWHSGKLSVARRENFQKVYDLPEKVIASQHLELQQNEAAFIDWACRAALDRLGFATSGEIAAFWDLISPTEAKEWCEANLGGDLVQILVGTADGSKPKQSYAWGNYEELLAGMPDTPARIRVLSPFDPVIRDRKRALRLFNFDYRIEIFVPEAKRKYGYYVLPLLEGDKLIGRIDMKHDRSKEALTVKGLWFEDKVRLTPARIARLDAELERMRRFTGAETFVNAHLTNNSG